MLDKLRPLARHIAEYPARVLAGMGVTPNAITVIGLLLNLLVALVIASGNLVAGGVLVLFANLFDVLDGAVARVSGKGSKFGAFFDSTLDRYAEAVVYLGVGAWLYSQGDGTTLLAAYLGIIGSLMVSYTRARAEGLGVIGEVGLLPRPERILLLSIGLLFHGQLLTPVLWLLALLANLTALQRMLHVQRELRATQKD